jgi:thioredoxin 1
MTKRFIMVTMLVCFIGFNVTGCSGSEGKKDSAKTVDVPALDKSKLEQTLKLKKYKMIEFGGRHCIPCKKMQPILTELAESYGDSISIANVYVQEQLTLGREYKVRLIPTQIIFDKEGKEVFRHTGFWEKPKILATWKELKIL